MSRITCINRISDFLVKTNVNTHGVFWGMFAPWGEGKTSLMNLVEEEICERGKKGNLKYKVVFVKFDAWKFLTAKDALASLSYAIAEQLECFGENRLASSFRFYGYMVTIQRSTSSCGTLASFIEGLRLFYFYYHHNDLSIERTLRHNLTSANLRIVLVVDDLERMPRTDAFSIIRFLKSNFSLPKMIVAVISDKQHLLSAIADGIDIREECEAERYLEKIIPLQFEVPRASSILLINYIKKSLKAILDNYTYLHFYDEVSEDFDTNLINHYVQNMRGAKRLLSKFESNLAFQGQLTQSKGINVHVGDFLALTVLQIWEERVYQDLPTLVAKIRDSENVYSYPQWGLPEDCYETWLEEHCSNGISKEYVKGFLKDRLKIWSVTNSNKTYYVLRGMNDIHSGSDRRLCSILHFGKYYNNFTDNNFVDVEIIKAIEDGIKEGVVPKKQLVDMINSHQLYALLSDIQGHKQFTSVEEDRCYLEMLIWLSNQHFDDSYFITNIKDVSGQKAPYVNNIYICIFYCISHYCAYYQPDAGELDGRKLRYGYTNPLEAGKILINVLRDKPSCHILCYLLEFDEEHHAKFAPQNAGRNPYDIRLFTDDQYDTLATMYLESIDAYLREGTLFSSHNEYDLLTRWIKVLNIVNTFQEWDRARKALSIALKDSDNKTLDTSNVTKELHLFRALSAYDNTFYAKAYGGIIGFNGIQLELATKLRGKSKMNRFVVKLSENKSLIEEGDPLPIALRFIAINKYSPSLCTAESQLLLWKQIIGVCFMVCPQQHSEPLSCRTAA